MAIIKYQHNVFLKRVSADDIDGSFPYIAFEDENKQMVYFAVIINYGV